MDAYLPLPTTSLSFSLSLSLSFFRFPPSISLFLSFSSSLPRRPSLNVPVHLPYRRGHQLGAPNSRVTRDAPLAWPGRARLLGAQMMYVDHSLSLSSSLTLAHTAVVADVFRTLLPSTYLCTTSMAGGRDFTLKMISSNEWKKDAVCT